MRKINNLFVAALVVFAIAVSMVSSPGCANIAPPTGGPRDSLPPRLVRALPGDSTRNFNSKKIVFEFDEYVQVDNVQENLLVSPTPKINPTVTNKLRTITVTIKDTLEPNTTYAFDFGNALKDINEGNVFKNFTYVFTTGTTLDSLTVSGNVIIAETGMPDSTLIVILHNNLDDSAVIKDRPRYVARLDNEGKFTFNHLPPGTFNIYALKDEGGQRKYMSNAQLFGFADKPINTTDPGDITLYAYLEKDTAAPQKTPPAKQPAKTDPKDKRLKFDVNASGGSFDLLDTLKITFREAPVQSYDSTKLVLANEENEPLEGYTIVRDTSNKFVSIYYPWTENTAYKMLFYPGFATDTLGKELLKADTLAFRTKKNSEYGLVRLRFINLDLTKNPVLLFVQNNAVKYSYPFTSRDFYAKLFQPGEYDIRILFDDNKNGIYDPGEFFGKHIQPEKVISVPRKVTVKANWDNEIDITL
ncbi:Ig-like domain-containing domain [Pseudoflavitalea rhizosphaerae]|uniref:Ig-like domain-containing domain n=1 Tax=Pseudoflavitalea rhizosphaerae TaxID=1884793 RepID=UPI000F8E547E|nr:Ig-like domain-containing domain [Pseudoflavitalea rhizosphaerae]